MTCPFCHRPLPADQPAAEAHVLGCAVRPLAGAGEWYRFEHPGVDDEYDGDEANDD